MHFCAGKKQLVEIFSHESALVRRDQSAEEQDVLQDEFDIYLSRTISYFLLFLLSLIERLH